jgi:hypothetical protein
VGGTDAAAGFAYQHAQAVLTALRLADETSLARIRVEGYDDAIDLEVWGQLDELVEAFQYKRRSDSYTWGQKELLDQIAAWSRIGAHQVDARYKFVTDGKLGPTGRNVRDALAQAALGDCSAIANLLTKASGSVDLEAVSRARIVVDNATYNALFERARLRARSLLTNVSSAAEADERSRSVTLELLHMVTDRSGRSDDSERIISASEVIEMLARPQDHLPTTLWGNDLKAAFLASVLSADDADGDTLDLACIPDGSTTTDRQGSLLENWINNRSVCVLSGGAGTGKSTALARMQYRLAKDGRVALVADAESYVPGRLGSLLATALNRHVDVGAHPAVGTAASKDSQIVVAIDSISEIPAPARDHMRDEIRQLLAADQHASVILAGRDAAASRAMTRRVANNTMLRVAPLDDDHRVSLIEKNLDQLAPAGLLTVEPAARSDQARYLARRVAAATGPEVAANPLMLLLGVRALLVAGAVINPAETFRTVVRSIAADNGYGATSLYEAGLGLAFNELLNGGTRYTDGFGWTVLLEHAATTLNASGHDLTAAQLREFASETGLLRVADHDVVRPLHDSFADYFAATAVKSGVGALPMQLHSNDGARVRFLAGLAGVSEHLADSVVRDLPLTGAAIAPDDAHPPSEVWFTGARRYVDALFPESAPRPRIALRPDGTGRQILIVDGAAEGWLENVDDPVPSEFAWLAPITGDSGPLQIAIQVWQRYIRDVFDGTPRRRHSVPRDREASVQLLTEYADELFAVTRRLVDEIELSGDEAEVLEALTRRRIQFRVHPGDVDEERRRGVDYREVFEAGDAPAVIEDSDATESTWTGRAVVDTFLTTTAADWAIRTICDTVNEAVGRNWLTSGI